MLRSKDVEMLKEIVSRSSVESLDYIAKFANIEKKRRNIIWKLQQG